jgi:hypothetical protein
MRRNLFNVLAAVCLLLPVCAMGFSGGSGTLNDPYLISTPQDLLAFGADPFNMNKSFRLTADIDMTGCCDQFYPLGSPDAPFNGLFNGGGYTISNLYFDVVGFDYIGLFGYQGKQGQIWNLTIDNMTIIADESVYAGAVAAYNCGLIGRCDVVNSTIYGDSGSGGIAGFTCGDIRYCNVSNTTITGQAGVGGICGYCDTGFLYYCTASVTMGGGDFVGGIAGTIARMSVIDHCSCSVSINGEGYTGGITGLSTYSTISDSDCSGLTAGTLYTGGVVGYNLGDIYGSTTDSDVVGGKYVGGIAGYNKLGTIKTTTSYGLVSGDENVGEYIGENVGGIFVPVQQAAGSTDLNNDGITNSSDLGYMASAWLSSGSSYNVIGPPVVDMQDFKVFAENWLKLSQ